MIRTHKENLKHLRAELEAVGVQVVGVRLNKRTQLYCATSCNFVAGGHCFYWAAGTATVRVTKVEASGREVRTGTLAISA